MLFLNDISKVIKSRTYLIRTSWDARLIYYPGSGWKKWFKGSEGLAEITAVKGRLVEAFHSFDFEHIAQEFKALWQYRDSE